MAEQTTLYTLTFLGLYLELAGAFFLSAEAIGITNLLKIGEVLRKHRVFSFVVMLILVVLVILLSKIFPMLHLTESLVLILSLGLINDFAPQIIKMLVKRLEKGRLGIWGFLLFAVGFSVQAYVTLSLLY